MNNQKLKPYFLLALLLAIGVLTFFIFLPFFYALILAAVFAIAFTPVQNKILYYIGNHRSLATLCTIAIIIIIILIPIIVLCTQIFREAGQLYFSLTSDTSNINIINYSKKLSTDIHTLFPVLANVSFDFDQYVKQGLGWVLQNIGSLFSNFTKLLTSIFVFLISLYYLLRDGKAVKKIIITLSPLTQSDDEAVFKKIETAIASVIKGSLIIAIVQGVLAGVGFFIFGVPNSILWATATTIAALIPVVGTALIVVPATIFLFLTGNTLTALGLMLWGILIVGLIDNFLRPILVGRGMKIHPLIIFLSVFGGLVFFGPMGFLLGPLTVSLFFALLDVYISTVKTETILKNDQ